MIGKTFVRIRELIQTHQNINLPVPDTIGISVDDAWLLLEEFVGSGLAVHLSDKTQTMMLRRDKEELLEYYKDATVYGVRVVVVDVVLPPHVETLHDEYVEMNKVLT